MALYVVATPIGHMKDITLRAIEVLKQTDFIAAEDTRTARKLCTAYDVDTKLISYHGHSTEKEHENLSSKLMDGMDIALISEAGTPGISDPGEKLIKTAIEHGINVVPIPGAAALITALVASGLSLKSFTFLGFIPHKKGRMKFLESVQNSEHTVVFYESCHRILASLEDLAEIVTGDRRIVLARELTKVYETVVNDSLDEVLEQVKNDANMQKGEFVVLVEGAVIEKKNASITEEQQRILSVLLKECSVKSAVAMAVEITGARKKVLYQAALELSGK